MRTMFRRLHVPVSWLGAPALLLNAVYAPLAGAQQSPLPEASRTAPPLPSLPPTPQTAVQSAQGQVSDPPPPGTAPLPPAVPPSESADLTVPALTETEIRDADRLDGLSIPTPGELLVALEKCAKVDWASRYRPPSATSFRNRPQMALNLGALIADGYVAVQAQDAQQVKNIGRDVVALAKPLGVQQEILNRGKSLSDFAAAGNWDALREELEATQNEAKLALWENKDPDLITLVSVGGWLRGAEALTAFLSEKYSKSGALLLRQPGIAAFLGRRLDQLPDQLRQDPLVRKLRTTLAEVSKDLGFPATAVPSAEKVRELHLKLADALREIARKDLK